MEEIDPILHNEKIASLKAPVMYYSPDLAIKAYHDALDAGLTKEEAERKYFEWFKNNKIK